MGSERAIALAGLLACVAAILVAHGAETFLGLVPCALCLMERRPYEAAALLAVLAMVLPKPAARGTLWALVAVVGVGAAISLVHVGVEQHWWPDPLPACSVPDFSGMTMAQRLAAMPLRPAKPCEDPDFLIPSVPISMTQMGFAYAVIVSAGIAFALSRGRLANPSRPAD